MCSFKLPVVKIVGFGELEWRKEIFVVLTLDFLKRWAVK